MCMVWKRRQHAPPHPLPIHIIPPPPSPETTQPPAHHPTTQGYPHQSTTLPTPPTTEWPGAVAATTRSSHKDPAHPDGSSLAHGGWWYDHARQTPAQVPAARRQRSEEHTLQSQSNLVC